MKKEVKKFGLLAFVLVLFNCSTVQVANSWKDVKTPSIKEKKVLVVSKTDNDVARIQFESDLVENLNGNQINATESFKIFPNINLTEDIDESEIKEAKENLKSNGFDVILLTVLKNVEDYTMTTTSGGSSYYINTYPLYYGRGFRRGFYRSFNTYYVDYEPIRSVTSEGKKYILETITYDLTLPEDNQLLSVITTEIDNPETLGVTSKDFSKKVIKELIK
ncbi:hypothetical protein [Seonamhaeicola maritimus]|uniref:DUF4136 domain-containing protein n=1 Tax=Seonamhaeicola maritimus TaxID=2591822 RepID=A0A5C7GL73_9FLAO|nr:hypothetical protein [Seonamhaeicola maritimus]TXG39236.1 hypothetical protein FUA22_04995 [Seonamhaeicola maritimus]